MLLHMLFFRVAILLCAVRDTHCKTRELPETLIQYDCMIQMFCPSLKASNIACLTAANSLNSVGGKHSFVMFVM